MKYRIQLGDKYGYNCSDNLVLIRSGPGSSSPPVQNLSITGWLFTILGIKEAGTSRIRNGDVIKKGEIYIQGERK